MPKIRAKPKNKDERCAVCRDASSGLVMCRGCSTLIHAACLIEVRGCPTIGCDEADPLQREPEAPEEKAPVGSIAKLMWEIEKSKNKRRLDPRPRAQQARAEKDEFEEKIAKAKATRMIPQCLHDFSPQDNRCIHCNLSLGVFAAKEFGSHWTGPSTVAEGERRHRVAKAAKEERAKQQKKHWFDYVYDALPKIFGWGIVVIFLILVIMAELKIGVPR
jgi:hypothetical protein